MKGSKVRICQAFKQKICQRHHKQLSIDDLIYLETKLSKKSIESSYLQNELKAILLDLYLLVIIVFFLNFCFMLTRFWWSLMVGVDWWDAVGCTQSAAEDGIGKYHVDII